jgi:hypothetical protein
MGIVLKVVGSFQQRGFVLKVHSNGHPAQSSGIVSTAKALCK